ncbi:MAG: hypothetical protein ABIJ46_04205 [bacterium]
MGQFGLEDMKVLAIRIGPDKDIHEVMLQEPNCLLSDLVALGRVPDEPADVWDGKDVPPITIIQTIGGRGKDGEWGKTQVHPIGLIGRDGIFVYEGTFLELALAWALISARGREKPIQLSLDREVNLLVKAVKEGLLGPDNFFRGPFFEALYKLFGKLEDQSMTEPHPLHTLLWRRATLQAFRGEHVGYKLHER